MDPQLWQVAEKIVQWLVIPLIAALWAIYQRQAAHDREILLLRAVMEERNKHRAEEKADIADAFRQLRSAIDRLNDKLDKLDAIKADKHT